jgi:hypothetical protein
MQPSSCEQISGVAFSNFESPTSGPMLRQAKRNSGKDSLFSEDSVGDSELPQDARIRRKIPRSIQFNRIRSTGTHGSIDINNIDTPTGSLAISEI